MSYNLRFRKRDFDMEYWEPPFDFGDTVKASFLPKKGLQEGFIDAQDLIEEGTTYSFIGQNDYFMSSNLMTTRMILIEKNNRVLQAGAKIGVTTHGFGIAIE